MFPETTACTLLFKRFVLLFHVYKYFVRMLCALCMPGAQGVPEVGTLGLE